MPVQEIEVKSLESINTENTEASEVSTVPVTYGHEVIIPQPPPGSQGRERGVYRTKSELAEMVN